MTDTLAFEAIDHFMLADDRDSHPLTFFVRLRLGGVVQEAVFRRAAARALALHPLLRALAVGDPLGTIDQLSWRVQPAAEPWIDCAPEGLAPRYPEGKMRLDLAREIGVRLFVRQGDGRATVLAQLHHAAVDGVGALRFLEDLLVAYAQLAGEAVAPRPLDAARLAGRGGFHLTAEDRRQRLARDLRRIALFFRKFPEPLALPAAPAGAGEFPSLVTATIPAAEVEGLRAGARLAGATVNDVLLSDLFRTVAAWNGGRKGVRLAMAINMRRGAQDDLLPACNVVSMCFLDRSAAQIESPQRLAGVVAETRDIKAHNMGYALVYIAGRMARLKGGMRQLVTPRFPWRCHASSVLSNVGRLFTNAPLARLPDGRVTAGGLVVDGCDFMPPVRPDTRAAFGVVSYRGELHLTLHYDRGLLAPHSARDLLDRYVATLRTSIVDPEATRTAFRRRLEDVAARAGARRSPPLRSLPIGKNVAPPSLPQPQLEEAVAAAAESR